MDHSTVGSSPWFRWTCNRSFSKSILFYCIFYSHFLIFQTAVQHGWQPMSASYLFLSYETSQLNFFLSNNPNFNKTQSALKSLPVLSLWYDVNLHPCHLLIPVSQILLLCCLSLLINFIFDSSSNLHGSHVCSVLISQRINYLYFQSFVCII